MDFHLNLQPTPIDPKIELGQLVFLSGSCFTEHMTSRLSQSKFRTLENPHGILFNPISICESLQACMDQKEYHQEDIFEDQGLWASWDFHGRFSDPDPLICLGRMNESMEKGHQALQSAHWLVLTLGSAFVYRKSNGRVVANCHKAPASAFTRQLLMPEEVMSGLDNIIHKLRFFNPGLQIIFTVSPVRHLREGLVENNRSKAVLIYCVHQLCGKFDGIHYFPAYELVLDDLRDYRFYAEDMVHPNYQATRYVWEKFCQWGMASGTRQALKEISQLRNAMQHRPIHPRSEGHRKFIAQQARLTEELAGRFPLLDFSEERAFFTAETGF
jgi:hypothetical protein